MTNVKLQLLLVDDSRADAQVLRALLQRCRPNGFELIHCTSIEECLVALDEQPFDCVFLDYLLEDCDGIDVLRAIRAGEYDVPVIAVSGNGSEQVAVESLKAGAQDYMVKGTLTPEAVERALTNAIEKVELARQLAERRQELEDFAHIAAHDLRAPLGSISLFVDWLDDEIAGKVDAQTSEAISNVMSCVDNMSRLLDSLLEYAQVGRSKSELEPVSLEQVVATVLLHLEDTIRKAHATVRVEQLPAVMGHPVALSQLIQNLVANAIKFRGEREPIVTVRARQSAEEEWTISIADNGIGIDPAHHKKIFAAFQRLHSQQEFEGTGIGLATCKRIVDHHGGQIWVESEVDRGTTFQFTLQAVTESGLKSPSGTPKEVCV